MKKLIFTILATIVVGSSAATANAQIWEEVVEHTLREEQEGKAVWDALQAKELACENLSDEQFGVLGEYFMGQMAGESHAAMNAMMIQAHGEGGEEQIHIVMGKRLSGCDTSAVFPVGSGGWMPMMNFGFGTMGGLGWIFMILWWVLIIAGIVALIKWLTRESRGTHNHEKPASPTGGSALEILQERYARGEINKQEFEEKKKDVML